MNGITCMAQAACPAANVTLSALRRVSKSRAIPISRRAAQPTRSRKLHVRANTGGNETGKSTKNQVVDSISSTFTTFTTTVTGTLGNGDPLTTGVAAGVVMGTVVLVALLIKSLSGKKDEPPARVPPRSVAIPLAFMTTPAPTPAPTPRPSDPSIAKAKAMNKYKFRHDGPYLSDDLEMYELGLKGTSGDVLVTTVNSLSIQPALLVHLLPRLELNKTQMDDVLAKLTMLNEKERAEIRQNPLVQRML